MCWRSSSASVVAEPTATRDRRRRRRQRKILRANLAARRPRASSTTRSITFRSSRMLPGHGYSCISAIASGVRTRRRRAGDVRQEMLREERNVHGPIAQRRQRHRDDVQAIQQIVAEPAVAHRRLEVAVARRHEPHRDVDLLRAADAEEAAMLERARQLGLQLRAQHADFVDEQRAVRRELDQPRLARDRAA